MSGRYREVTRVLTRVLFLNLAVAAAKIGLGYATGAVSILSDGFHSLTDTASNVVGMVGVRIASRPPDENHPYGHRKFETMAAIGILVFLLLVLVEVLRAAVDRLGSGATPAVPPLSFVVMAGTLAVNVLVVRYERRAGRRLASEVLLADARHTMSDVFTSSAVIVALVGVRLGVPMADPLAALVIAGFIGRACWEIFEESARVLADEAVIPEEAIRDTVNGVPGVIGCHQIRSRGSADHVFVDLHIWLDAALPLHDAHEVSHDVKDRLMERFPAIQDAIIHIEPPPQPSVGPPR
ncbi:MAG: cation diffusion facilitator family transporter [Vicinamibacterales bacterium]